MPYMPCLYDHEHEHHQCHILAQAVYHHLLPATLLHANLFALAATNTIAVLGRAQKNCFLILRVLILPTHTTPWCNR